MRVDGFAMMPNFTFGLAIATFVGQNIGAKQLKRVDEGIKACMILTVGVCTALVLVLMQNVSHKMAYFSNVASTGLIRMTVANKQGSVEDIERVLISNKIEIQSVQINKSDKEKMKLEFEVIYPQKLNKPKLFCALAEREDVISISE
jgi:uncharacterized membrane protein YhiD involved in acid resistance